ncbi:hypothetical protein H9P43_008994 [Blastocladiella emersonii ATCC 22665]|nr:hypothetical protein H9P43_008994 [Blastocladiella emersonii ATCC 22665]
MPSTLKATVTRLVAVARVKARSRTTLAPTLATRTVKSPGKAFTPARKVVVLVRGPYTPSGDETFVELFHKRRYKFSHKTKRGKRGDESDSMTIADARGLLVTSVKSAASNYVLQLQIMTIAPPSDRSATQAPVIISYVLVPLQVPAQDGSPAAPASPAGPKTLSLFIRLVAHRVLKPHKGDELIEDLAPMIQLLHCPSRNKERDMEPWKRPDHAPAVAADDAGTIKQYAVEIIAAIAVLACKFVMAQAHEGAYKSMDRDKATAAHKAVVGALYAQDAFDAREVAKELLSVTIGPEKKK